MALTPSPRRPLALPSGPGADAPTLTQPELAAAVARAAQTRDALVARLTAAVDEHMRYHSLLQANHHQLTLERRVMALFHCQ